MKNHRSCRTHWRCESQAPKRNHPKRPKEDHPKNFLPNKIIPKDVDPKPFLSKNMTAPKNTANCTCTTCTTAQSRLKAVYFLLESPCWMLIRPSLVKELHLDGLHLKLPGNHVDDMLKHNKMGPVPIVINGVIYNPYKWPEING